MTKKILAKKIFQLNDLKWFAEQSGDYNPIHINESLSRRYISGGIIVPGMYILLWSLNKIVEKYNKNLKYINAKFHHFAILESNLELYYELDNNTCVLSVKSGLKSIATFSIIFSDSIIINKSEKKKPPNSVIKNYSFKELRGLSGNFKTYLSNDCMNKYSALKINKMENIIAILMSFSRLVGMKVPGLNSLFIGLEINLDNSYKNKTIKWNISRHTNINSLIFIDVKGNGCKGHISTMYRPEPVNQMAIKEIYTKYKNKYFSKQVALIIGGSRGLGEHTAKLLGANGSEVIITYNKGIKDALRVKKEIENYNSKVHCIKMNILEPSAALKKINLLKLNITHVYYFASPKIHESRQKVIDDDLLNSYNLVYVKSFEKIIEEMFSIFAFDFKVFYPSSVFINHNSKLYKEYTKAKLYAEKTIKKLLIKYKKNFIYDVRLPRLRTDQNPNLSNEEQNLNIEIFVKELLRFSHLNVKKL